VAEAWGKQLAPARDVPAPEGWTYAPQFDPVAYCAQRFRSYNPATGLYFGYDGQYHPCP